MTVEDLRNKYMPDENEIECMIFKKFVDDNFPVDEKINCKKRVLNILARVDVLTLKDFIDMQFKDIFTIRGAGGKIGAIIFDLKDKLNTMLREG